MDSALSARSGVALPALGTRFWVVAVLAAGVALSALLVLDKPAIYLVAIPAAAVAIAILRKPRFGVYLIALALPLDVAGNLFSVTGTFNISVAWIFTLLTLLAWGVGLVVERSLPRFPPEVRVLVAYLLIGVMSLATAQEFDRGVEEVVRVLQTILFFLMVLNLLRTPRQVMLAVGILVTATVASFAYALAQKFVLPANIIQERGLDLLKPGAVTYGIEMGRVDTHGLESVARVTGTTLHAGMLALNCAYMLPFIMLLLRLRNGLVPQALGWFAVLLTLGAFGTTLSRSGFLTLGFTLVALVATGLVRVTGLRLAAILLFMVLGVPFLPDGFIERVLVPSSYLASNSASMSGRLEMWAASVQAILDHPLTGFGIGNEHGIFDYWMPEWRDHLGTVMNTWLQIPMEVGILGLLAFVVFVWLMFRCVLRGRRNYAAAGDHDMAWLGTAMLVLLSALVVSWMSVEFLRGGFKNVWFLLACMVAYRFASPTIDARPRASAGAPGAAGAAQGIR